MASPLRILRRHSRWRLRHERPASSHLRGHAPLVRATLPCHAAGLFSSRQHHRHGRLLSSRPLDLYRNALLLAIFAGYSARHLRRTRHQSPPARRRFSEIHLSGISGNRRDLAASGNLTRPPERLEPRVIFKPYAIPSARGTLVFACGVDVFRKNHGPSLRSG